MHAPQIIVLALMGVSLLLSAHRHDKPKTGRENFWISLLDAAFTIALLWWGGFFGVVR